MLHEEGSEYTGADRTLWTGPWRCGKRHWLNEYNRKKVGVKWRQMSVWSPLRGAAKKRAIKSNPLLEEMYQLSYLFLRWGKLIKRCSTFCTSYVVMLLPCGLRPHLSLFLLQSHVLYSSMTMQMSRISDKNSIFSIHFPNSKQKAGNEVFRRSVCSVSRLSVCVYVINVSWFYIFTTFKNIPVKVSLSVLVFKLIKSALDSKECLQQSHITYYICGQILSCGVAAVRLGQHGRPLVFARVSADASHLAQSL